MISQTLSAFRPDLHRPPSQLQPIISLLQQGLELLLQGTNLEEEVRENFCRNRTAIHRPRVPTYPGKWMHADTEVVELRRIANQLRVLWMNYQALQASIPHLLPSPQGRPSATRHLKRRYFHELARKVTEATRHALVKAP